MGDDLVKRLREEDIYDFDAANELCNEAADRIEQLEEALREIADIDYRGNAHPSASIARAALGEKKDD